VEIWGAKEREGSTDMPRSGTIVHVQRSSEHGSHWQRVSVLISFADFVWDNRSE